MSVFTDAAEILERDGWGQTFFKNPNTGCYCTLGALYAALDFSFNEHGDPIIEQEELDSERYSKLNKSIETLGDIISEGKLYRRSVATWNDTNTTSYEDVLELLQKADEKVETE